MCENSQLGPGHCQTPTISGNNPFLRLVSPQQSTGSRLAVLEPSDDPNAPIKLTLINADLKDTLYECISYDRSGTADAVIVVVDGTEHEIPRALESALRTFRRKDKPRTLWADVLVARTAEERSKHATEIRQILENAQKTLCWLGPGKDSTVKAFDTIHDMANRWSQACLHADISQDTGLGRVSLEKLDSLKKKLNDCPYGDLNSSDFSVWKDIYDVFSSSYWRSIQCIAEIVLAKLAIVVCGRSNIRWHNYVGASRALPFFQTKFFRVPLLPHVQRSLVVSNAIEIAERRHRLGNTLELFPMMQTARDCGASDPRDYVFSIVPISTPSDRVKCHTAGPQPLPAIDYSKSIQQVFIEAARYVVLERQDLMLWYAERPPCGKRIKGLPSWVPDFSVPMNSSTPSPNNGLRHWWETVKPRKNLRVSHDNALLIQAYPLGRIEHASIIFNNGNAAHLCYVEYQKLPAPTSETVEQRDTRFWRTLLLNSGGFGATLAERAPPPAEMGASFRSLVAEETILKILGCTPSQIRTPEVQARMRENPEVMALLPQCGKSTSFRMFTCIDMGLGDAEDKSGSPDNLGEAAHDLGKLHNYPFGQMMTGAFLEFLAQRDPETAKIYEQAIRGQLSVQKDDQTSHKGGVTKSDIVVACIGGFFPYILRPCTNHGDGEGDAPLAQLSTLDSSYEFVGDCYLHGSMNGEDFKVQGPDGRTHYLTNMSRIVDTTLV
ncbi:hypothetical protein F5Y19DRAFT_484120 [Xylariaceae sp. FL1651]|nr:hypothetical protein F5Y19DRAFT_484120 [Xylariaceae sp. FL1651]